MRYPDGHHTGMTVPLDLGLDLPKERLPYLRPGSFGAILSASGFGLTTVLQQIAATAAVGGDPFGLLGSPAEPMRVSFLAGRDSDAQLAHRFMTIRGRLTDGSRSAFDKNLSVSRIVRCNELATSAIAAAEPPACAFFNTEIAKALRASDLVVVDGYEAFGRSDLSVMNPLLIENFLLELQQYLVTEASGSCLLLGASLAHFNESPVTFVVSTIARSFQTLQIRQSADQSDGADSKIVHFLTREKIAGSGSSSSSAVTVHDLERRSDGMFFGPRGNIVRMMGPNGHLPANS